MSNPFYPFNTQEELDAYNRRKLQEIAGHEQGDPMNETKSTHFQYGQAAKMEMEQAMNKQQVTLADIQQLTALLGITFSGGSEQEEWFDLDTGPDAQFSLNGTYRKTTEGIANAYGDLVRYRDRIEEWQAHQRQQANTQRKAAKKR